MNGTIIINTSIEYFIEMDLMNKPPVIKEVKVISFEGWIIIILIYIVLLSYAVFIKRYILKKKGGILPK
jgi:ABC-type amino acid transport system permease subunit